MIEKRVLKIRRYKRGYVIQDEEWRNFPEDEQWYAIKAAYTPNGQYIGDPELARYLIVERGIAPEYRTATSNVCSIGYCAREKKWYGWSHRAMFGFGLGDMLFEANVPGADEHTPFNRHGIWQIVDMAGARQAACNFAEYVS